MLANRRSTRSAPAWKPAPLKPSALEWPRAYTEDSSEAEAATPRACFFAPVSARENSNEGTPKVRFFGPEHAVSPLVLQVTEESQHPPPSPATPPAVFEPLGTLIQPSQQRQPQQIQQQHHHHHHQQQQQVKAGQEMEREQQEALRVARQVGGDVGVGVAKRVFAEQAQQQAQQQSQPAGMFGPPSWCSARPIFQEPFSPGPPLQQPQLPQHTQKPQQQQQQEEMEEEQMQEEEHEEELEEQADHEVPIPVVLVKTAVALPLSMVSGIPMKGSPKYFNLPPAAICNFPTATAIPVVTAMAITGAQPLEEDDGKVRCDGTKSPRTLESDALQAAVDDVCGSEW